MSPVIRNAAGGAPLWLFVLFSLNGPAVNFMGQWRYVEILLLALLLLNFRRAIGKVGTIESRFILLFVLSAIAHIFSDIFNDVNWQGTFKRAGTYLMLCAIIVVIQWLSRNDPRRISLLLAGYCFSFVILLYVGSSTNENYAEIPWRLGLGNAATLFLCLLPVIFPRFKRIVGVGLLALAVFHVFMEARTLAALTTVTGCLTIMGSHLDIRLPPRFRINTVALVAILGGIGIVGGTFAAKIALENKILPENVHDKMERQMSHPYGMLAAGRPETATAIYAISKRPLLGYGSIAYDSDVHSFYAELSALKYQTTSDYASAWEVAHKRKQHFAIPSHSHLFSAWADAGIVAAICWMAFLGLAIYVLARTMFWRNVWSPLFIYVSLSAIWDVLFSPGPVRVDVAVKLMILTFAVHQFRSFDLMRRNQRASIRIGSLFGKFSAAR